MKDLKKTIKENTPAIITSVIIFLLVSVYLIVLVPANEQENDNINKSTLEEFNLQFNSTIKDFANQVDIEHLKDSVMKKAERLCLICDRRSSKDSLLPLLNELKSDTSSILKNIKDSVVINSVRIDSVVNKKGEIIVYKRVNLGFSPYILAKCKAKRSRMLNDLSCIKDTSRIDREELRKRLSGAISFSNWVIYSADNKDIFINQAIDKEEFDSLKCKTSKSGVLTFSFSGKRFYRQSVAVDGTSNTFILVGAISQADFERQSRKVNIDSTFVFIFFLILLLLSIPLIKPLISSRKERQRQLDLLNTTFAIGILAIVLVSFSFSQYLSAGYRDISSANLMNLHDSISKKLNEEFKPYYNAFNIVSSKLEERSAQPIHYDLNEIKFDSLAEPFMKKLDKKNFQNFFTFNSKGDQIKDVSDRGVFGIRRNFSERDYFQVLKEKTYSNMLTAVFSRFDNRFKFVYVRKNFITEKNSYPKNKNKPNDSLLTRIDTVDFSLSGFAFHPVFMKDFKCTVNTGYILCNNTGRVILNSDMNKSLHEDIYASSQKNYELSKMLHGMPDTIFEMNYNGEECLFFAKKYTGNIVAAAKTKAGKDSTYNATLNDYPLYLLTYKNLGFTNDLKIYSTINGFILSVAYVLTITLLVILFSIFFYFGEISVLSRFHLHWLFPDNSRKKEYVVLKWINYSVSALFLILFINGYEHVLYLAFLSGINLAFINFILLNQRVFLLTKDAGDREGAVAKRNDYLTMWFFLIVILGYLIPFLLFKNHLPAFGLSLSLLSHFIILYFLKKDTNKNALPENKTVSDASNRPVYISFFSSVISFHYILIPLLIIFNLFSNEMDIAMDLNNSYLQKDIVAGQSDSKRTQDIFKTDGKVISALPIEPPSKKYLDEVRFDNLRRTGIDFQFMDFVKMNYLFIFLFMISLIAIAVFISRIIDHYSGRFFFFELSEAYRLGYFNAEEPIKSLTNFTIIIPPYSEKDLENLEVTEKLNDDIPDFIKLLAKEGGDSKVWLKGVPSNVVSNQIKVELIMIHHFEMYRNHYKDIWDELSEEEKFVMNDFAADSFVNYKNRNILMNLMEKGYIIADPLTGRLRVMNYGFRNFIIHLEENDPESAEAIKAEEEMIQGTYSKWKLPLMIIAVSGILMFMYLNKESFNHVLLVGGSAITAIGFIAKFLNAYKQ